MIGRRRSSWLCRVKNDRNCCGLPRAASSANTARSLVDRSLRVPAVIVTPRSAPAGSASKAGRRSYDVVEHRLLAGAGLTADKDVAVHHREVDLPAELVNVQEHRVEDGQTPRTGSRAAGPRRRARPAAALSAVDGRRPTGLVLTVSVGPFSGRPSPPAGWVARHLQPDYLVAVDALPHAGDHPYRGQGACYRAHRDR